MLGNLPHSKIFDDWLGTWRVAVRASKLRHSKSNDHIMKLVWWSLARAPRVVPDFPRLPISTG